MHRLLERQLKKAASQSPDGKVDADLLIDMVNAAYEEADHDRRIRDHALQVMQAEVEELNRRIRQEAELRFNVLMDNVGEAVVIMDEDGVIEGFNKAAEHIFGCAAAEVIGRNVVLLMTGENADRHHGVLANYLRTGEHKIIGVGRETTARRKNGDEFPIELAVGEITSGPRRHFVGVIRDISLRKHAEKELRESESRFRDLVGSASDWFWETDAEHRLTFVSERIATVLGVNPSALVGTSFFDLGLGEDATTAKRHEADLASHRPFRDLAFHVGPAEGTDSRTIRISGIPIMDKQGQFLGYRGVGVDVTREVVAEQRAHSAMKLLADAIECIVDGIAVYDADDRLVLFNGEYRRVFAGMDAAIVSGSTFEEVMRAGADAFNTQGLLFDEFARIRLAHHREATGQPFVVRMADGRWILHREFRMTDGGVVGLRTDITEMKKREQELEELKRRYKLILDSAGEGIVGLDPMGEITFANRTAGSVLGHDPADMIGSSFQALVQPPPVPGTSIEPSPVVRAYRYGVPAQVRDEQFCRADGECLPVDYLAAPIIEEKEVAGAVVVFRDASLRIQYERTVADNQRELARQVAERTQELSSEVGVRARTEAALRESRERLKAITDSLFEGVLVVNRSGHVVFANPSALKLLGWTEEPEGLPIDYLFSLGEAGVISFDTSPWRHVTNGGGTIQSDDALFTTAKGEKLSVAYACSCLLIDGEPRGAIISFRDIQTLKQAQRDALQASRMASVGQLAAGIAHEINTPTQYIGDNLRFIRESFASVVDIIESAHHIADQAANAGLSGPAAEFAAAAEAAEIPYLLEEIPRAINQSLEGVGQVGRIVLSMKEFSHPGSNSKTMTDINRALESTLTVSRNTWKLVAEVETDFDPALPSVPCFVGELNQVFLNLIVNAAQAIESAHKGPLGRIAITTEHAGDEVVIRISDSGNGVPHSIREKIFDPFFTTKIVGKGTGQGLAICRDVVVGKHGGRLDVDGIEGEGAVFTIRLPIESREPAGIPAEEQV